MLGLGDTSRDKKSRHETNFNETEIESKRVFFYRDDTNGFSCRDETRQDLSVSHAVWSCDNTRKNSYEKRKHVKIYNS